MNSQTFKELYNFCYSKIQFHNLNYKHFSFIYSNTKQLAYATNTYATPPLHLGYARLLDRPPLVHSELAAYSKFSHHPQYRRYRSETELINFRLNNSGEIKLSRPCVACIAFLRAMKIKKVIYSDDQNIRKYSELHLCP